MASPSDLKLNAHNEDSISMFFIPITPTYTGRYVPGAWSKNTSRDIPMGVFKPSQQSLPIGWSAFVQPEGQVYFEGAGSLPVLTDAYMYKSAIKDKVLRFSAIVSKFLEATTTVLPASAELYLMPSDEEDVCYYYLADHASHTLFWLQSVNSDQLCIPDVVSDGNLQYALEDLYWQHMEQFPSHRFDRLYLAIDELLIAFLHGEVDQRTSVGSTFPYGAEDCKHFVRVLQIAKEQPSKGESVCIVARLWSNLIRQRQQTHFAQERARLDRLQKILDAPGNAEQSICFRAASRLLLGVPGSYAKQFEDTWTDSIVYVHIWRDLLDKCKEEWRQHLSWSLGMSIINALFLLFPETSHLLAGLSLVCCAVAAVASLALLNKHATTSVRTCDDAVPFLSQACADAHRSSALAFGAPRAFFLYAVGLAAAQALLWLEHATSPYVLGACIALVVLASLPWARWGAAVAHALPSWRGRTRQAADADAFCSKV